MVAYTCLGSSPCCVLYYCHIVVIGLRKATYTVNNRRCYDDEKAHARPKIGTRQAESERSRRVQRVHSNEAEQMRGRAKCDKSVTTKFPSVRAW